MSRTRRILDWIWNGPAWKPIDPTPQRRPRVLWWLSLVTYVALATLGVASRTEQGLISPSVYAFHVGYGAEMAAALWLWWRRPATRVGHLLMFSPLVQVSADLVHPFPDSRLLTTYALGFASLGLSAFVVGIFNYPTGRPPTVWVWRLAGAYFAVTLIWNLGIVLFYDARGCPVCAPREPSYVYLGHTWAGLQTFNQVLSALVPPITISLIGIAVLRLVRSSRGVRRALGPYTLSLVTSYCTGVAYYLHLAIEGRTFDVTHRWYTQAGNVAIAVSSVAGVWTVRRSKRIVADLVVDLDGVPAGGVRDALARATGDPTLQLALWHDTGWIDHTGEPIELPTDGTRAVTDVGDHLAALVHDPDLADQHDLLKAIGSAGRLALENERLHAELKAQLTELRDSRTRILSTAAAERRKLEGQLRDSAHSTLEQVDAGLGRLAAHVDTPDGHELLRETKAELDAAFAELQELARGLHPTTLTDHGLDAAVRAIAQRMPIPVETEITPDRLPVPVETAAYYIVAEALTNITRYANASHAAIHARTDDDTLTLRITDNGAGGADPARGTGLSGLHDRIAALDGTLHIDSPSGEGTTITATIPLRKVAS